jgi:two-component system sensor histidine kinase SenX3
LDAADDPHEVHRFGTKILNEANRLGTLVTELIVLSRHPAHPRPPRQPPTPHTHATDTRVRERVAMIASPSLHNGFRI